MSFRLKEKSPRETPQGLEIRYGATYGDLLRLFAIARVSLRRKDKIVIKNLKKMVLIDDKRIITLIDALEKNGWKKVGFSDQVIEWYFAEIIEFVSVWSPQGKKLFMVLLIDQFDYPVKNIIDIGFSLVPNNVSETLFENIYLKDILKTDLKKFCERLNDKVLTN